MALTIGSRVHASVWRWHPDGRISHCNSFTGRVVRLPGEPGANPEPVGIVREGDPSETVHWTWAECCRPTEAA